MKNRMFGIFTPENRGGAIFIFYNFFCAFTCSHGNLTQHVKSSHIITPLLFVLTVHHLIEIDFM